MTKVLFLGDTDEEIGCCADLQIFLAHVMFLGLMFFFFAVSIYFCSPLAML